MYRAGLLRMSRPQETNIMKTKGIKGVRRPPKIKWVSGGSTKPRGTSLSIGGENKSIRFDLGNAKLLKVHITIEGVAHSFELDEEQTGMLRIMLSEGSRYADKSNRKERSERNKALWALAKAQGYTAPTKRLEQAYDGLMQKRKEYQVEEIGNDEGLRFDHLDDELKSLLDSIESPLDGWL